MSFQGWPEAALDFFEGLERDNSKAYWAAHRRIYDEAVLAPMTELTEELAWEFGDVKLFRPYRDIRFSADKSPYRTEIGARVGSAYIRLSRYRDGVADDVRGTELERIIAAMSGHGITLIGHEVLKSAPRGYPADHSRIRLLRHKGLAAYKEWPVEPWLATAAARDHVREFLAATRPLTHWLDAHVGPSALESAGRR